jgi:hypothetical protein
MRVEKVHLDVFLHTDSEYTTPKAVPSLETSQIAYSIFNICFSRSEPGHSNRKLHADFEYHTPKYVAPLLFPLQALKVLRNRKRPKKSRGNPVLGSQRHFWPNPVIAADSPDLPLDPPLNSSCQFEVVVELLHF